MATRFVHDLASSNLDRYGERGEIDAASNSARHEKEKPNGHRRE
jgi:hypothetical protein